MPTLFDLYGIPTLDEPQAQAKELSLYDRFKRGVGSTVNAGEIAISSDPGRIAGLVAEESRSQLPQSESAKQMASEIKPLQAEYQQAQGWDAVGAWAKLAAKRFSQLITNPREAAGMIAENLPNSAPGMAGGVAGGVAGAATPVPGGALVGSVAGGTAGGYLVEQGAAMRDQVLKEAQARGIDPRDEQALAPLVAEKYNEFISKARLKGIGTAGTDAVLNRLTLGLAGAGERAIVKEASAVTAGLKAGTIGAKEAGESLASLEARQAARNTLGARVKHGAGITGAEMAGEGISEAAGQALAYGQVDALDVIDESLLGLGQGGSMALGEHAVGKGMGVTTRSDAAAAIDGASAHLDAMQRLAGASTVDEAIGAFEEASQTKGLPPELDPGQLAAAAVAAADGEAQETDSPFADRVQALRAQLEDPATREGIRSKFGAEALRTATYYATAAGNANLDLPEQTRSKFLDIAEMLAAGAHMERHDGNADEGGGSDAHRLVAPESASMPRLGMAPAPTGIEMDQSPSGTVLVDEEGNARPQTRAEEISTRQRRDAAEERRSILGTGTPWGAAPRAQRPSTLLQLAMDRTTTGRLISGADGLVRPELRTEQVERSNQAAQQVLVDEQNAALGLTPDIRRVQGRKHERGDGHEPGGTGAEGVPVVGGPRRPGGLGSGSAAIGLPAAPADPAGGGNGAGTGSTVQPSALDVAPSDLTTRDGKPYGTRSAAVVRARREGGEVVEVDGGWVVRVEQPAAEPAAKPLAGDKVDHEWTRFAPESGTLSIPRADMPQIRSEHRGAMVNFLNARGIEHEQLEVDPRELKPTQAEFSPSKVEKAIAHQGGDRSILVSSDGHVLDGHHQWMARHERGEPVKVIRLNAPINRLLSEVREFPSVEQSAGATTLEAADAEQRQPAQRDHEHGERHVADAAKQQGKGQAAAGPAEAGAERNSLVDNDREAKLIEAPETDADAKLERSSPAGGHGMSAAPAEPVGELPSAPADPSLEPRAGADGGGSVDPMASRSSRSQSSHGAKAQVRLEEIERTASRIASRWVNPPEIVVVSDITDSRLPDEIRQDNSNAQSRGATGEAEGYYFDGKVYLIANMLPGDIDVVRVLAHEALGHFGLHGFFGDRLDGVLQQVIDSRREEVVAKAEDYGLDTEKPGDMLLAAEEVLASLAQVRPQLSLVQRAIAAVRTWLRENVPGFAGMQMSDAEIVHNFIVPARDFVTQGAAGRGAVAPAARASRPADQRQALKWASTGHNAEGPEFYGPNVSLIAFRQLDTVDEFAEAALPLGHAVYTKPSNTAHHFMVLDSEGGVIGEMDAEVGPDGQIEAIHDIELGDKRTGMGRRVVAAILANASGPVRIVDIIDKADEFWRRMGAGYKDANGNATADWSSYQGAGARSSSSSLEGADQGLEADAGATAQDRRGGRPPLASRRQVGEAPAGQGLRDFMEAAKMGGTRRFNALHRTLATQLHKATVDADFARAFQHAQDYERDVARAAARPAETAPDLLPTFDNISAAWQRLKSGNKDAAKIAKVGEAVFLGTLEGGASPESGKVWMAAELRERFGLDDKQIELYRQARAAIDASLDETAAALAYEMVKKYAPEAREAFRASPAKAGQILDALGEKLRDDAGTKALADARAVLARAGQLKAGGYAPLMRFGRYAVEVREAGELIHFEKFETELQAKTAALKLQRQFPKASVSRSTMSQEDYKLFAGVDPESVALFADQLGDVIDQEALQKWYRSAVSERSAFKRMIGPRKGMAGFSSDLRRVVASFITSNARLAARQMNMGDMASTIADMRERRVAGDVIDEAMKLKDYIDNPDEPFKGMRSLMFTWYLGGSVASAAVNATQPLMMTLPYLSQFGTASKHMAASIKEAMSGKVTDEALAEALRRAAEDGKVDAQEIHHLYHEGMSKMIDRLPGGQDLKARAQGFSTMWGWMFGAVENFNRRLTFIAAYRMAQADPKLGNPYAFAVRAIDETQGVYGKSNRPNWARGTGSFGAVGVAAFTFKQYSIAYVELLVRLAKSGPKGKAAALAMLGMLVLGSGLQGLPGAEDLEDLVDTAAQRMGYRGNTRAAMRETLIDWFGSGVADAVMYGGSSALPVDIQGRIGLGNLLPASGLLKPTEQNKRAAQVAEIVGPFGGLAGQVMDAIDASDSGKGLGSIIATFAPLALKNAAMGAQMMADGEYKDARGRKVTDTDAADAFIKALGFQPTAVAERRRPERMIMQDIARVRQVESDIVDLRARAMAQGDKEAKVEADAMLASWNERNPDLPIKISSSQVVRKVREMRRTSGDRLLSTAPRETRKALASSLQEP